VSIIEAAFDGRLGATPTWRTSAGGKRYLSLSLAVGRGDELEWVSVTAFDKVAAEVPADLDKGERVYVEGKLTVWRREGSGGFKATLGVMASKVLLLDRIGRRRLPTKPKGEKRAQA
jgi:single-stranded DNA-binding protein